MELESFCLLARNARKQVVGKTACTDAEQSVVQPFVSQDFFYYCIVFYRILRGTYATGNFNADFRSCELMIFLYCLTHRVD